MIFKTAGEIENGVIVPDNPAPFPDGTRVLVVARAAKEWKFNRDEIYERIHEIDVVVERNPEILGGRPCFRGARAPVDALFDNLADGMSVDEIIESHPAADRNAVDHLLKALKDHIIWE